MNGSHVSLSLAAIEAAPATQPVFVAGITEWMGWEWNGPDLPELTWQQWLVSFVVLTTISVVGSLLAVRWVIKGLPEDYFSSPPDAKRSHDTLAKRLVRNIVGLAVLLVGLILLVTPGQGILLILTGVVMIDLPGKRRVERSLAARPRVLTALNWVRTRLSEPRFLPPP